MRILPPLLLVTLFTVGCSHLQRAGEIGPAQIREWLEQDEYGNALATLQRQTRLNPDDAMLREWLEMAKQNANLYAQKQIEAADQLARQDLWEEALQTIDSARQRWPQSAVLRIARDELETRRQRRIDQLQLELLLHEGRSLLESARQHRELEQVNPGYLFLDWNLRKYQARRQAVARRLLELAREVQKEGDLRLAQHCLIMAQRLDDTPEVRQALHRLPPIERVDESEEFRPLRYRSPANVTEQGQSADGEQSATFTLARQQRLASLLSKYARAQDHGDLLEARRIMQQMVEIDPSHPRVRELRQENERLIRSFVEQNTARGDELYSQERIEEAIGVWQRALRLAPSDKELQNKLDRARTALQTLHELKQQNRR